VRLIDLLERAEALEQRAAALYRGFAAARRQDPELAALWTTMAADEDDHARSIREARHALAAIDVDTVSVEGCGEALAEIAQRLRHAEALRADAGPDRQFSAALDLELSELESMRQLMLQASHRLTVPAPEHEHLRRLADTAMRRSQDGHVRLGAALLLARARLAADAGARHTD
jgi:hypothetical protein